MDERGYTPLHAAADKGHTRVVNRLLQGEEVRLFFDFAYFDTIVEEDDRLPVPPVEPKNKASRSSCPTFTLFLGLTCLDSVRDSSRRINFVHCTHVQGDKFHGIKFPMILAVLRQAKVIRTHDGPETHAVPPIFTPQIWSWILSSLLILVGT